MQVILKEDFRCSLDGMRTITIKTGTTIPESHKYYDRIVERRLFIEDKDVSKDSKTEIKKDKEEEKQDSVEENKSLKNFYKRKIVKSSKNKKTNGKK